MEEVHGHVRRWRVVLVLMNFRVLLARSLLIIKVDHM